MALTRTVPVGINLWLPWLYNMWKARCLATSHEIFILVQAADHSIRVPMDQQFNGVRVYSPSEERYGAFHLEGAGTDI